MGAVLLTEDVASALVPGDHATTFGGGPLVATVAQAVVETITAPAFLSRVRERGEHLAARLAGFPGRKRSVVEVRGRGLMWGIVLRGPAAPVVGAAREGGLLVTMAGPTVIRLVPPLIVAESDVDRGLDTLAEILA